MAAIQHLPDELLSIILYWLDKLLDEGYPLWRMAMAINGTSRKYCPRFGSASLRTLVRDHFSGILPEDVVKGVTDVIEAVRKRRCDGIGHLW